MAHRKRSRAARPRRRVASPGERRVEAEQRPKNGRRTSKGGEPKRRRASAARSGAPAQAAYSVADIVGHLHGHRQRATYGAVGALRGAPAVRVRGWFAGREAPENSFVVSRISGEPTGYAPERIHPALKERVAVIESADALRAWLDARRTGPS